MTNQKPDTSSVERKAWFKPKNASHGRQQFGIVPVAFLLDPRLQTVEGGTGALKVFVAASTLANASTGLVGRFNDGTKTYHTYSLETLGKIAGLARGSVSRALTVLENLGWADVKYRHTKTLVIHLKFPDAELNVLNERGGFLYESEPLTIEDAEAHENAVKARVAKYDKYTVHQTTEELNEELRANLQNSLAAKETVEFQEDVELSSTPGQQAVPKKNNRLYKYDAIRDVATYIARGQRTLSEEDVTKFHLSYSMTIDEFKSAAEGFEHCYTDLSAAFA